VVFEDKMPGVSNNKSAIINAGILIGLIAAAQIVLYGAGGCLGRLVEAAFLSPCQRNCQCCTGAQSNSPLSEETPLMKQK